MADRKTFHPTLYRDTTVSIRDREQILNDHIRATLRSEAFEGMVQVGETDMQFTWKHPNRTPAKQQEMLELERQRQAILIADIGVELGIKEERCFDSLPDKFPERLSSYDGVNLNIPLLVPRFHGVKWNDLAEAIQASSLNWERKGDISDKLKNQADDIKEWPDPKGFRTPRKSYSTWVRVPANVHPIIHTKEHPYGIRNPDADKSLEMPDVARMALGDDIRGATHWDGLALAYLRWEGNPMKWDSKELHDLIGTQINTYWMISMRRDITGYSSSWLDVTDSQAPTRRAAIICSRQITTKG